MKIPKKAILPVAAASELMFFIALAQDDVIDNDKIRGGRPSAHIMFGTTRTMVSADYATGCVWEMLEDLKNVLDPKTLHAVRVAFLDAHKRLYRSFLVEMGTKPELEKIDEKYIRQIHLDKTVQGINALYCTGIVVDNLLKKKVYAKAFKKYAEYLAIAGQIKNDVYDFTRYPKKRGFSDLRNGYITYPILHLIQNGEIKALKKIYKSIDGQELCNLLENHGTIGYLSKKVHSLTERAISVTGNVSLPHPLKEILTAWAKGNSKINDY